MFRTLKQNKGESIDKYYMRCRQAASTCNFTDIDAEIKSQIIQTTHDEKVRRMGLRQDSTTLSALLDAGRSGELVRLQSEQIAGDHTAHAIHKEKPDNQQHPPKKRLCFNCGNNFPHEGGYTSCPAYGKTCFKCNKANHFKKVCKQKTFQKQPRRDENKDNHVHEVEEQETSNDYVFSVTKSKTKSPCFEVIFDDVVTVEITADTAASCNIIDEHTYQNKLSNIPLTHITNTNIKAYGGKNIDVLGSFKANVSCQDKKLYDVFYVVKGHGCLLGLTACQQLGLITIAEHVCKVVGEKQYPGVFEGIGKLKGLEVDLHIDETIPPVAQRYRRVPYYQRQMVEQDLNNLLDNDIIEQAEHDVALENNRLQSNGLTVNKDKCEFSKQQIGFFGMHPDPKKVEALSTVEPDPVVAFLDINRETEIVVDASPVHFSTGVPPATVLNGQPLKTKLPEGFDIPVHSFNKDTFKVKDRMAKVKMKRDAERRRRIQSSNISVGDTVLMKNTNRKKLTPMFQPEPVTVVERKGSMIVAKRGNEQKARNCSFFRKINIDSNENDDEAPQPKQPEKISGKREIRLPQRLTDFIIN